MGNILNFITWDVSPTIFSFGIIEIRWYSLLFALGLLFLGPRIEQKIWIKEKLPQQWFDKLFVYIFISTIIGARLGHCLFYEPMYYLAHPIKILKIWEGGLASHGGTLGIIIAVWFYSKKVTHKSPLWTLDRLAVPVGLVAALIRLGNLMNSEIFGSPTSLPWGFKFLRSQEYLSLKTNLGCHPTAIYEAIAYICVFALCMFLYWKKDLANKKEGAILGSFFIGIFGARFIIESVKLVQEPWELKWVETIGLNQGQILSIPFILAGLYLIFRRNKITNK